LTKYFTQKLPKNRLIFFEQLFLILIINMKTLHGVGVALVTPFNSDNSIDFESLKKLINFVISNGVNYVVSLGTTGETPTLTKKEKLDVLNFTIAEVNDSVPIVAGAGGNNTIELIEEIKSFPLNKIAALLSASPYYNKPSQQGIYEHYKAIATAIPDTKILLYNVPGRTGKNVEAETTIQLATDFKNIIGIKEAANNIPQCSKILRDAPKDFLVLSGDDDLCLAQMGIGMHGVISVAANCLPKQFCQMIHAAQQNNFETARKLNSEMLTAYDLLFAENNPAGVKAFLTELGVIQNYLRLPLVPLSQNIHNKVKNYLAQHA
jgi:4-hydroxy-tetrahydrodipicolinate synthase